MPLTNVLYYYRYGMPIITPDSATLDQQLSPCPLPTQLGQTLQLTIEYPQYYSWDCRKAGVVSCTDDRVGALPTSSTILILRRDSLVVAKNLSRCKSAADVMPWKREDGGSSPLT